MLSELARLAAQRPAVVLDDDPTGTQTLRNVWVLTEWSASAIARHLDEPVVFLSTNSRSLETDDAVALATSAVSDSLGAARERNRPISLISRSDSTLRGHFPVETNAMATAAGITVARVLLAPFFAEGGRVTVGDIHYVERGGRRTPVAKTEFARDHTFGYGSSNLRDWVAEKHTLAGLPVPPLASLSLDLVRSGGPDGVCRAMLALPERAVVIANAETNADIECVALGALRAEEQGLPLIARVAASYVRGRAGREPAPLVSADELGTRGNGLILVGSHVDTTTRQLVTLRERLGPQLEVRELGVRDLIDGRERAIGDTAAAADATLRSGRTALLATERRRAEISLDEGRAMSRSLASIVARVESRPAWVLAKGGITSSDVARLGLGIRAARVAGQLLPGVPVWIGGPDTRWPGVPLIVFPGNVGDDEALAEAVRMLSA